MKHEPPNVQDDYTIIDRSSPDLKGAPVSLFAVVGPGLSGIGAQFHTRTEAEEEGRRRAAGAKVALWFLEPHTDRRVLVQSFRDRARSTL
jgi:hypothetical protein